MAEPSSRYSEEVLCTICLQPNFPESGRFDKGLKTNQKWIDYGRDAGMIFKAATCRAVGANHYFHIDCAIRWGKSQRDANKLPGCPVCRKETSNDDAEWQRLFMMSEDEAEISTEDIKTSMHWFRIDEVWTRGSEDENCPFRVGDRVRHKDSWIGAIFRMENIGNDNYKATVLADDDDDQVDKNFKVYTDLTQFTKLVDGL